MFFVFPRAVKPEICDQIVTDCKQNILQQAKIGSEEGKNDPEIRKTSIHFITEKDNKINELVWHFLREANKKQFHYDLEYFQAIQFAEYNGRENYHAFYDWHVDADGRKNISKSEEVRKLSLSLPLSDPATFEGGKLEFYNGCKPYADIGDTKGDQIAKDINSQGTVIVFDSKDWHRVTPVESGTRHSIVCWTVGPNFK
jgi:PKHD-type hydroxylase